MELKLVTITKPDEVNFILGQSHFIKTVEDIYEAIVGTVPGAKFGLAFCESSGPALVRAAGTDDELVALAKENALALSTPSRWCRRSAASSAPAPTRCRSS